MGIIMKELYKIKIVFWNVKFCWDRYELTKESFMKITEFDPNLEDSKWSKMLRRIIKRIEKHKQYYLSGKKNV